MRSNLRKPYLAAPGIHTLPSHLPLGELGLLPVNAYLIGGREPVLVDTGLAVDRGGFDEALWSLVDPRDLKWVVITHIADFDHDGGALFSADSFGTVLPETVEDSADADHAGFLDGMALFTRANAPWTALAEQTRWEWSLDTVRELAPNLVLSSHAPTARARTDELIDTAAKEQGPHAAEQLDLALRRAFWAESRCISNRKVIMDAAESTGAVDTAALAEALDDGRARSALSRDAAISATDRVTCSPHLFLPDGTDHPNPGIEVYWEGDYGVGWPVVSKDDPTVFEDLIKCALA